ncbi:MAG: hypothetical protein A3A57_01560 [Candidatus Woykebacteria bacterium RIFCSPLOWO2_01_FULL_41_12]|uniref:Uncharacterized protein n=1 Tax=Candidatus Woykebacteria bacterium RIFCSPLOWO2_01_FULL_41_12 TaxID=1802604 RepID=A0A1G1WX26_9BACT|nr:MAG: hypothetical protein A3A57_01560 [Candidatus Woykebacteria bacterium RIFCSPLOWO2_01_FULL_41_12]
MGIYKKSEIVVLASLLLVFLFVATPVLASLRPFPQQPRVRGEQTATPSADQEDESEQEGEQARGKFEKHLGEAKLRVCEKLEDTINNRSDHLLDRVNKHIARFDRISSKVQTFYTEKMVPKGINVENYETLVGNIATKKAAAVEAAANAAATIDDFDCSGDSPGQALADFHDQMHVVIKALKEYKKSVVDLIVAVRTAFNNSKETRQATSSAN